MNVRTTIMLERPILDRIREQAHRSRQTLRKTLRDLILAGLSRVKKEKRPLPSLPTFNLGREKVDVSHRVRLYEMFGDQR